MILVLSLLHLIAPVQAPAPSFLLQPGRAGAFEVGMTVDEVYRIAGRENVRLTDSFAEGRFTPAIEISPQRQPSTPPSSRAPAGFNVRLETTKGPIVVAVHRDWAPHGADRFYELVTSGYYDEAAVFRIRKGTWAQFGIAADPKVAQAWRTKTIPDDPYKGVTNKRGTVAFAFKDPNGRTTQVFINLKDNSETHDKEPFVIFGEVTEGMEVADALYAEYGEAAGGGIRAGRQDPVFEGGNAYLKATFPLLDYIRTARVVRP